MKKINYQVKELMVQLSGACFWFWDTYYDFLISSGVSKNVKSRYPRESFNKYQIMREVLENLEEVGDYETLNNLIGNFYRMKNAVDRDKLDETKAKSLLAEFRDLVGNDPIETEIKKKEQELKQAKAREGLQHRQEKMLKLTSLKASFMELFSNDKISPQDRGFDLEKLFSELLALEEVEYNPGYRTKSGEQIDGLFQFDKFDYMVELKWIAGLVKQKHLSEFDGKIRGKAQSTRGLFISVNGFDSNAISKFSGDSPRIILMTGQDLIRIFDGYISFLDCFKAKVSALVKYGSINHPV